MAEQPNKKTTGKKPRQPTAATLYRHILDYLPVADVNESQPVSELLAALKDEIVREATGR